MAASPRALAEMGQPPLVVLGVDAGDPELLLNWAGEGDLPTLAGILERGCWAGTSGAELVSEHGTWVSLLFRPLARAPRLLLLPTTGARHLRSAHPDGTGR